MVKRMRFVVRRVGENWTFGREDQPYQSFKTRELALLKAKQVIARTPGLELVIEDEPPAYRRGGERRGSGPRSRPSIAHAR